MTLFVRDRHEVLTNVSWSSDKANQVAHEIIALALAAFQGENLWPVHPDLHKEYHLTKPSACLWMGAAGSMWALDHLQGSYDKLIPYLAALIDRHVESVLEFDPIMQMTPDTPGYLLGLSGINLLRWKLSKDRATLALLADNIQQNIQNPTNELMWAAPGTMLCALFLYDETQEQHWLELYRQGADYLFSTWEFLPEQDYYAWVQHMYGSHEVYLGLIHGFMGSVFSLIKGFDYLTEAQQKLLIDRAQDTLFKSAIIDERFANWLPCVGNPWPGAQTPMLQLCHGSPSMVIGVADLWPYASDQFRALLLKAGELVWHAGPLKKPWGLCHGTAGNGYAFLKLFHLSGDQLWLERARKFAMHAIEQYESMKKEYGCIRTDSWCGDLGLALYLQDCIDGRHEFPMLDYF